MSIPPTPFVQTLIVLSVDWEIACASEGDPFLQEFHAEDEDNMTSPSSYPAALRTPLLPYHTTFQEDIEDLNLSPLAAEILDCVRALTLSIIHATSSEISIEVQNNATCKSFHSSVSFSRPFPWRVESTSSALLGFFYPN